MLTKVTTSRLQFLQYYISNKHYRTNKLFSNKPFRTDFFSRRKPSPNVWHIDLRSHLHAFIHTVNCVSVWCVCASTYMCKKEKCCVLELCVSVCVRVRICVIERKIGYMRDFLYVCENVVKPT